MRFLHVTKALKISTAKENNATWVAPCVCVCVRGWVNEWQRDWKQADIVDFTANIIYFMRYTSKVSQTKLHKLIHFFF